MAAHGTPEQYARYRRRPRLGEAQWGVRAGHDVEQQLPAEPVLIARSRRTEWVAHESGRAGLVQAAVEHRHGSERARKMERLQGSRVQRTGAVAVADAVAILAAAGEVAVAAGLLGEHGAGVGR